jgi:hypothetical protein
VIHVIPATEGPLIQDNVTIAVTELGDNDTATVWGLGSLLRMLNE